MNLEEMGYEDVKWILVAQDRVHWLATLETVMDNRIPKDWESLYQLSDCKIFETDLKI
jgi:hypothetical protein